MTDIAVRVENLGKRYRIGQIVGYSTLRESLMNAASAPFRWLRRTEDRRQKTGQKMDDGRRETEESGPRSPVSSHSPVSGPPSPVSSPPSSVPGHGNFLWALKDVSFEVKRGEAVGIIGRNGSGKTTILKILSRITAPTEGCVEIHGRVGSLLEVGTGFHPELTGRENIYLNGAVIGMKKAEVQRKFDEIIAFSEIENFLDTPVKRYSSGMYVRLAFAVAAHLEPEILIVDEVLAVGDAQFQKKCLGKMGDVTKEGRTVLFVSHNMAAVQSLCERTVWLHDGKLMEDGDTGTVISNYLKTSSSASTERMWNDIETAPGNEMVRLRSARIRPKDGSPSDLITVQKPIVLEFEYWNLIPNTELDLSIQIYDELGTMAFLTYPMREPTWHGRPFPAGLFRSECYIPGDLLNDGTHHISLSVAKNQNITIFRHDDILAFDVHDSPRDVGWLGKWPGIVRPNLEWRTELLEKV